MDGRSEGFDMPTGWNPDQDKNGAIEILLYLAPKEKEDFAQLSDKNSLLV